MKNEAYPSVHINGLREDPMWPGYLVSRTGEVFSLIHSRCHGRPDRLSDPRRKAMQIDPATGYFNVTLSRKSKQIREAVHRMVARAFIGPRPFADAEVRHRNGIRTDNRPENLLWGSHLENCDDMLRHGTRGIGETASCALLTNEQVATIRGANLRGVDGGFLSRRFGMQSVTDICAGKTYAAVQPSTGPDVEAVLIEYARYPKRNSGTKNRAAKLTDRQVLAIRKARLTGETMASLARQYNVSYGTIQPIIAGRTWRHLLPHAASEKFGVT